MDKEQELKNDILDSISNSFHDDSPRSHGGPNGEGLSGWGNQKASILGTTMEKPQIRPQRIVIKGGDRGIIRPVSSNTMPTSLESSPIRKFFVRAASKENKRFKMDTEKKSLYEKDFMNSGMDEIKAQLKAFSSKNYLWLQDKPPQDSADKYFDQGASSEKRESTREDTPYGFQKDTFSRLLLKAAEPKALRSGHNGNPLLTKISDLMGVARIRIPKPTKDPNQTASTSNNPFAGLNQPSKRKISNKSFYNASISYSRKTFMGMSMITPNNVPTKDGPSASEANSTFHSKKSSQSWQVHTQSQPVQGQSSSHFTSTAFPQVVNLSHTATPYSIPLLNQTQNIHNTSQTYSQTMSNSPSQSQLIGDGSFQYYAQRLGQGGGSQPKFTEMSGSGRSSPPILHAKRMSTNMQKMKGITNDFFKDEKGLTSAGTKRTDEIVMTFNNTKDKFDLRSQSVKVQARKRGKITKGMPREIGISQLPVNSISSGSGLSSQLFSIVGVGGKVGSRLPFPKGKSPLN